MHAPGPPAQTALPFVAQLADHADRPALFTGEEVISYRELSRRVSALADKLGHAGRRLVLVAAANRADAVIAYLAALAAGHAVLLTSTDRSAMDAAIEAYDPDLVLAPDGDRRWAIAPRRGGTAHRLHPDLALVLSTSGSTGAAKSVRLSYENLRSNAQAIAGALGIRSSDRAATTLPLQYCYGLSVLHSHLLRGAGILLTEASVVDPCFWERFRAEGGTSLAGVPYTFDLLDRVGFTAMDLPDLRLVTQAGGRLAPDRVAQYAELGRQRGWQFVVMYGQTEATARMAVLPPELARSDPGSIGRPIPGGSFRLDPVRGEPPGVGELVYQGPNVMLGYATSAADLAHGRTVEELRTGDLAQRTDEGLYRIVGRRSGFLKIAGLRIDLEQVERLLAARGLRTSCTGDDGRLVVGVEGGHDHDAGASDAARRTVLETVPLPPHAVQVLHLAVLPRLENGKPDRAALRAMAAAEPARPADAHRAAAARSSATVLEDVRAVYASSLERTVRDQDTFVGLGGDSLSYVQVSLALEEVLGDLPRAWPGMTVAALAAAARTTDGSRSRPRWLPEVRQVETGVVLRAAAILLIVSTHVGLITAMGGAHVLLAVAGFNFARFQLTPVSRLDRLRSQARALVRIVVPAVLWIGLALVITDDYEPYNLILGNAILGPERWASTWHFWFIELLVYILGALALLLAIPQVDRAERRWPFAVAGAVLAVALLTRAGVVELGVLRTLPVLWLFAVGWAASRAGARWQRLAVLAVAIAAVPGYFGDVQRELTIVGGLVLLILVPRIPLPTWVARGAGVLASASLYTYLVHWQVFPLVREQSEVLAVVASITVGIGVWLAATRVAALARVLVPAVRRHLPSPGRRPGKLAVGESGLAGS